MSPLNRGPLMGPRMPPVGMRPMPPPRFGSRLPPPGLPGIPPRLPPRPMNPMFGPMRQRPPLPPGPGGRMPMFGPRVRGMPPMLMQPMMGPRGMGLRGPPMRPAPRGMLPPQCLPHMRARLPLCGINMKSKGINNFKKVNKLEELELKKPWMTDEIRSEIVKKNKLYAKAKKNKDAKEWDEFKDLRNKVTRMIRDAKTEYLAKNADQVGLYSDNDEPYDTRDENDQSSENEEEYYCEVCDREFASKDYLERHMTEHRVCGIDGCTFSAHEKLVEKHISMQHSTGLYQRMKNLTTPEDIAKWIQERKARYPTKANIEQQKAEAVEKKNRSEVIREKKTITENKFSKNDGKGLKKRRRRKRHDRAPSVVKDSELQLYSGLRPFSGTLNLRECTSDTEHFDDDCKAECTNNISIDEEKNCQNDSNSLSLSLVADYGTDSDLDGPEEIPIKLMKVELESLPPESNANSQPGSCIPKNTGKKCMKSKISNQKDYGNRHQDASSRKLNEHNNLKKRSRGPKPNQLLNKLLSRSIQHERNLICQSLKYIMDNKIFD